LLEKPKRKKSTKVNAKITFHAVVAFNEGVDVKKFILEGNDYMGEPKNADGCIVALTPKDVEIIDRKKQAAFAKQTENTPAEAADKLDKFLHFSFRGIRFVVDTESRTISCSGVGLASEMISDKMENGYYFLNVETSN